MENDNQVKPCELYRRIGEGSDDSILEHLLELHRSETVPEIRFLNFYKEVPISSAATIMYAFGDTISFRSSEIQARAILASGETILQSGSLPHSVLARAEYQPDTSEIIISDLRYVEVFPERRATVRVKMGGLFPVMVEAGPAQFGGKLREISLCSCAVDIADAQLLGNYKYFYLNLEMPFKTFKGNNKARVMMKLFRLDQIERGVRCIFTFEHDNTTEDQIGRLVMHRQTEIIRELT